MPTCLSLSLEAFPCSVQSSLLGPPSLLRSPLPPVSGLSHLPGSVPQAPTYPSNPPGLILSLGLAKCLGVSICFVSLSQTRVTWEEGTLTKKMSP